MATLRLAGNYIIGSAFWFGESEWGHLQVVHVDGDIEREIEVQAPTLATISLRL